MDVSGSQPWGLIIALDVEEGDVLVSSQLASQIAMLSTHVTNSVQWAVQTKLEETNCVSRSWGVLSFVVHL